MRHENGQYMKKDQEENISHIARGRFNYSGRFSETGDFNIAFIGILYSGAKTIDFSNYLPEEESEKLIIPLSYTMENDYWLQEAYGSLYIGEFMFRAGRQKYYTGTGYAWNPTDLFNRKNVFDPTYEIEGLDSILMSFSGIRNVKLNLFYSFGTNHDNEEREGDTLDANDLQVRIKTRLRMWDIAINYSDVKRSFYDIESLLSGMPSLLDREIRWQLISTELSGEIFGIGIHAEGGYAFLENENSNETLPENLEDHFRYLVGVDYTFENELFLLAEYYYEGLGETSKDDYSLNYRLAYFQGAMDSIGRDNLFVGARYPLTDLVTFEVNGIFNLNDPSIVLNPWVNWIASDDIVVNFVAQIPIADGERTAIGRSGTSMFVRLNFSF